MKNNTTIQQIREISREHLDSLNNRQLLAFQVNQLEFDEGISLNGIPFTGKAFGSVMSFLRVKRNFNEYAKKMTPEDWNTVAQRIKRTEGETVMYAKTIINEMSKPEITRVFLHNQKKKADDSASYRQYFEWLEDSLTETVYDYDLKSLTFDDRDEKFSITLLGDHKLDVFGGGSDLWKVGDRFEFDSLKFRYSPFIERLVCSNGATVPHFGYGANISQAKFNNKKIADVINKSITAGPEKISENLYQAIDHIKANNISIAEFYQFRKFFEKRNENGEYDALLYKFFNDDYFFAAYDTNVREKSRKWQSTANSGINGYDFYNAITYVASHPEEVKITTEDQTELQIAAGNLLFKNNFDLEDIASQVKVEYPVLDIMK